MKFKSKFKSKLLVTLLTSSTSFGAFACATCGCALSSDAAMGYSSGAGWSVSAQYDFINQNQLRSGTGTFSQSQLANLNYTTQLGQEVENQTINRYLTLGVGYAPNADWNFKLFVPYVDRTHTTHGSEAETSLPASNISGAQVSGIGDIKLITSFQGILPTHNLGVQLGVKLPTGNYGGQNNANGITQSKNPTLFSTGPYASAGQMLDTSLQAGNGSTDVILGGYYYQAISQNFDAFVNGQFQGSIAQKLNQIGSDYRPGDSANLSFGVRYEADPQLVPQLQVNVTHKAADQGTPGASADTTDTGGTVVYLSPGVSAPIDTKHSSHVYAFLQLPVYSKLDGYQLFPHWTASVGLTHAF